MDGGAWWATVHGVTKSRTQLSNFTSHAPITSAKEAEVDQFYEDLEDLLELTLKEDVLSSLEIGIQK